MNRETLRIVMAAFAIMIAAKTSAQETNVLDISSPANAGCENPDAGTPEIYSFFGDADKVLGKVGQLKVDLPKRKIYVLIVEGPESAEILLYEAAGDGKVNLSRWSSKSAAELRGQLEEGIITNRGIHCTGEQAKAIVRNAAKSGLKSESGIEPPASVKAATSHAIQQLNGKFIRATVVLLC